MDLGNVLNNLKVKNISGIEWDGKHFLIGDEQLADFRHAYHFFDKQIVRAELWYQANPKRIKKNHFRFIVNWMNKNK